VTWLCPVRQAAASKNCGWREVYGQSQMLQISTSLLVVVATILTLGSAALAQDTSGDGMDTPGK
jgi:hypothetical protein